MDIIREQKEIEKLYDDCCEQENEGGSKFPGMTYEQGIKAVINWLEFDQENHPLDD